MNMLKIATILVSNFLTFGPLFAHANTTTSYLDPSSFGDCIAIKINEKGGQSFFNSRIAKAKTFRSTAIENSLYIKGTAEKLNFITRNIFYSSAFASLPFIDFADPALLQLKKQLSLESSLFNLYNQNNSVAPVDRTDIPTILATALAESSSIDASQYINKQDIYIASQQQAASIANPLVTWLASKPKASVSHWDLLNYATQLYGGDILTALGVIGEMFWQDTLQASPERLRNAVLSSKMKPLISPATENPVGDNYHFWQILTASYYEGGTTLGRLYSKIDSNDPGHILANSLGLDTADRSLAQIGNTAVKCDLPTGDR